LFGIYSMIPKYSVYKTGLEIFRPIVCYVTKVELILSTVYMLQVFASHMAVQNFSF
jgi:hypothetical protein